jgi:transposase
MRMSNEEKLRMVLEHLKQGIPFHKLAKSYDYDVSNVKYFVGLYCMHGKDVFLHREETTIYTREQKLSAIDPVNKEHISYRQLGLQLGLIDPGILRDWVNLYKAKGEATIQTTHGRKSYLKHEEKLDQMADKSLKDRLEYLEAENAYLKKLYALIQKRSNRIKKYSTSFVN